MKHDWISISVNVQLFITILIIIIFLSYKFIIILIIKSDLTTYNYKINYKRNFNYLRRITNMKWRFRFDPIKMFKIITKRFDSKQQKKIII